MARVVVVGAGVSGLATAEWLQPDHDVVVLEAGPRAGGNVHSERVDGVVLERSANGFLDNEPAMARLIARLQLGDQVLPAQDGARYLFHGGELVSVPTGPISLLKSPLLPWWAKLRLALEPWQGPGAADETVAAFAARRLGRLAGERLVGTMVLGIWAGKAEELSLPACFPKMRQLEREHGSLIRAMRARRADPSVAAGPPGHLTSFRLGLGTLTRALAARLDVRTGVRVTGLRPGWVVETTEGEQRADAVVLATPAWASAELLGPLDDDGASALAAVPYAPVAVVCQTFSEGTLALPGGFGVLVPRAAGLDVLGTLFTSNLFPDHAPGGRAVVRSMVGGAVRPELPGLEDSALVGRVQAANAQLLGPLPDPEHTAVFRHPRGIPQYTLGHLDRVARVRAAEGRQRGLFVTGNHLEGVAIKDCVRDGERTASRVAAMWAAG